MPRKRDLGELIDADQYPVEQRLGAHIALHQVYGVDLNVELAEISPVAGPDDRRPSGSVVRTFAPRQQFS